MAELVTLGETPLLLSPPGRERLDTARELQVHSEGTESSAAISANALGTETTWVSKLPDTALGQRVVGEIRRHGIDTDVVWTDPSNGRQGIVYRESGSLPRSETSLHDQDRTAFGTLSPNDLQMDRIQRADGVFSALSSAVLSELAGETIQAVFRAAHGSGATTALDVDFHRGLRRPERYREALTPLLEHLDVLIGAEDHLRSVLDRNGKPRELANTIAADHDIENVVVVRNDWGAVALQNTPGTNIMHERETIEAESVDTSGQRGAFAGGFLHKHLDEDADVAAALTYAVGTATLARTLPGPLFTARQSEIDRIVDDIEAASQ